MKKRILAVLFALVLTMSLLTGLTACGGGGEEESDAGSVYYLNFKPEAEEAWQKLAAAYTEETGVDVQVVTAASGEYENVLMSEMGKDSAPTLFQVNGPAGLANWKDYCLDLSDSAIYGELTDESYALKEGDAVYGIAYVIESYGIIANTELLEKAGYSAEDIQSFEDLKKVAEDISARSGELGFTAFTSAGMDGSSDWRFKTHLANLPIYYEFQDEGITSTDAFEAAYPIKGTYLDNYRQIFDLYVENATCEGSELPAKTGDDSKNEFLEGQAAFLQNGSWMYTDLVTNGGMNKDSLTMLPIYVGAGDEAKQGLCAGTENYWCVNSQADQADIDATLEFINWCVTSETGTAAMADDMGFVLPFNAAVDTDNIFMKQYSADMEAGKAPVAWSFLAIPSENWKNDLGSALAAYAADQSDANWEAVEKAFVDGWAAEYEALKSATE